MSWTVEELQRRRERLRSKPKPPPPMIDPSAVNTLDVLVDELKRDKREHHLSRHARRAMYRGLKRAMARIEGKPIYNVKELGAIALLEGAGDE